MTLRTLALAAALVLAAGPADAFRVQQRPLAPSESVWKPADTPPGGVAWSVLESTGEKPGPDARSFTRPAFPAAVQALGGRTVKVAGYMLPLQPGERQTHFILLAYPPDCPFHLNPGPQQYIEVKTSKPVAFNYGVTVIEGRLQLLPADPSGVFYRMENARAL